MSAETLRAAAALMRERAEATRKAHHPYGDTRMALVTTDAEWSAECENYLGGDMGEHCASWHPEVALAVADWLDESADIYEPLGRDGEEYTDFIRSLAVARAYLGSDHA